MYTLLFLHGAAVMFATECVGECVGVYDHSAVEGDVPVRVSQTVSVPVFNCLNLHPSFGTCIDKHQQLFIY